MMHENDDGCEGGKKLFKHQVVGEGCMSGVHKQNEEKQVNTYIKR